MKTEKQIKTTARSTKTEWLNVTSIHSDQKAFDFNWEMLCVKRIYQRLSSFIQCVTFFLKKNEFEFKQIRQHAHSHTQRSN